MTDTEIQDRLISLDGEYRGLHEKHRDYEARLSELSQRLYLTPSENVERINLKKYKLRAKDRMHAIYASSVLRADAADLQS